MAILHRATLTPTKPELLADWLDQQSWGGEGPVEVVGSYRFDDPEGAVGVEAFIIRRGETLLHALLTYRAEPLAGAEQHLAGTMDHSVLGERWIYDGRQDPVAVACLARALSGQQEQASIEVYDGDELVERRDPDVRIERRVDSAAPAGDLRVATVLREQLDGHEQLVATWSGGEVVVAAR